jgi:hypothetical protein
VTALPSQFAGRIHAKQRHKYNHHRSSESGGNGRAARRQQVGATQTKIKASTRSVMRPRSPTATPFRPFSHVDAAGQSTGRRANSVLA